MGCTKQVLETRGSQLDDLIYKITAMYKGGAVVHSLLMTDETARNSEICPAIRLGSVCTVQKAMQNQLLRVLLNAGWQSVYTQGIDNITKGSNAFFKYCFCLTQTQ